MTFIIFILILSILVLVHEFGHFIVAKRNGIRVEEFGWGLPPRIWGKQIGETLYSINLLPFGGFVKLTGEDGEDARHGTEVIEEKIVEEKVIVNQEVVEDVKTTEELVISTIDPRSFMAKKPWQRALVLVAGVFMNIVLAVVLFYVFFFVNGFKTFQFPLFFDYKFQFGEMHTIGTVISDVQDGSAAQKAGVSLGTAILSVDGVSVSNTTDVKRQLADRVGQEVTLVMEDLKDPSDQNLQTIKLIPTLDENGAPILGVYLSKATYLSYDKPLEKIFVGPLHAYNMLSYSNYALAKIISLSVSTRNIAPVSQSVSGPVGIYNIVGGILHYSGDKIFLSIIDFIALMSVSLAFINILPFPALDGGRIVFVIVEAIRGKRLNPALESKIHAVGMACLLTLIVLITLKDIFH
jgi:regulator of sigma E protease